MHGHPAVCCLGLHLRDAPACRGRYECARALLRAGADPNYINAGHDLTVFWAIDGGVDMTRLLHECAPTCSASCHPLELIEAQAGTAALLYPVPLSNSRCCKQLLQQQKSPLQLSRACLGQVWRGLGCANAQGLDAAELRRCQGQVWGH